MNIKLYTFIILLLSVGSKQSFSTSIIQFYGHNISIKYKPENILLQFPLEHERIKHVLDNINTEPLIEELDELSYQMQLDDIAYLQLTKKIAQTFYCETIVQKLFTYDVLKSKNYDIILCFGSNHINIYGNSNVTFYNINSVIYKNKNYYDLYFDRNSEFLSEIQLEKPSVNSRSFVINSNYPPKLNALTDKYKLHMEYDGLVYFFHGKFNKSLALYYKDLPDIEFSDIYMNYGLSNISASTLLPDLKNAIAGMSTIKALDFILNFTQQAFPYKNDIDKYGTEKFSFPEELFLNINADCEDKSFMLAYLTKQLLDLKSIGLIYLEQNHLNIAVTYQTKSNNYNFVYDNQKYLVCEPSGLGLKPGENVFNLKNAYLLEW